MKFFGKEVPPRSKAEIIGEYGIRPEEPIFRPKPDALDTHSLVEKAKTGDAIDMVPELDDYFDGWLHYAQDRNLFSGTGEMQALAQARREAIQFAREKKYDELQAKLEELSGPLAENVEKAADANLRRLQEYKETTPKERREHLEEAVYEVEGLQQATIQPESGRSWNEHLANLHEQAPKERAILDAAEAAYLEEYKDFHRKKGLFQREPEELQELKAAYNESRIAYANALEASVAKRLDERGLRRHAGGPDELFQRGRVMRRYNSMIRFKAVVAPAAEKLYEARLEAMSQQEKGIFRKGLEKMGEANAALESRFGKKGARFVRAAATTLIAGGAAAAFGAFGTAGLLGILGWGTFRFGRSIASSIVGAAAGEGAAQLYGRTLGKRKLEEAREELKEFANKERHGESSLNINELERYDRGRLKLKKEADERTLEQKKMLIRVFTAIGVGAGTSAVLAELPSAPSFVEHAHAPSGEPQPMHPEAHAAAPEHHAPAHSVEARHAPEAVPTAVRIESVSVQGNVNDADKLFGRFLDNVKGQFPNPQDAPPALRTLLEQYHHVDGMHQQDVLTKFLHLQNGGSVVVHPGDSLSYESGKVIFQGHTLINEHGSVLNLRETGQVHIEHPHAEHAAQTEHPAQAAPEHETAQPESPTIQPSSAEPSAQPISAPVAEAVPAPQPEHVATPSAPESAPFETSGPHIVPEQTPTTEIPSTHPLPSNDNAPVHLSTPEPHVVTPPAVETVPGIIHNAFGIDVDLGAPHLYQLHQPGAENPDVLVAYGGSLDDRLRTVQQFLARPENANKMIFVTGTQPDPITHNLMTNPWKFDAVTKQVNPGLVFTDQNGLVPPPPGPEDLQKIIQ